MAADPEEFDYLVLGGGSGGIASARRAAAHGAKVAVIERARLGGTCVNVGCVPKKVMFNAASVKEMIHQAAGYGFSIDGCSFDLPTLKEKRDAYVARLNGIYRNNLKNSAVTFIEGDASFAGPKLVSVGEAQYTAKHILVAVGGTPARPPIPGSEHAIDSDGFFDLTEVPEKVAVIGSGYIAVELAGILNVLGSKVDLFIRGETPLRNMEVDVVEMLVKEMQEAGINIISGDSSAIEEADGKKTIHFKDGTERAGYDEVLFATGRKPVTTSLNLDAAGISTGRGGIIEVDEASRTSAEGVFALGDVIGKVDLTPVAIAAGRLLSDRLFAGASEESTIMDYDLIPTVVFSHPPLAVMGLTESQAIERYGVDKVTVHKTTWVNMVYSREFLVPDQPQPKTMAKLVCVGDEQRIVGVHMIGLAVDEILQGFGVAIKLGATKADFDSIVAIHPTSSEELVTIAPWQAKYKSQVPLPEVPVPAHAH
eukprot:CAMPEP_0119307838 /NCGR_PEP_ID=MMETSP1333-20130426/8217_1 /TAXON_ID=418940 /ORGANISM="Scyphosphaera apsteinii, Strain RCC1455" /LENGTH=480 /DNA_ID=CAMNT_0007311473 /DNA_START=160 /DNA_END=1602 /DNA_ORIENTATION=-